MNGILGGNDLDFAAAQGNNGGTAVRLYKKPALFVHAQHGGTVSIGTSGPYFHMATRQGLAGQIIGQEIPTATAAVKRPESIEKSGRNTLWEDSHIDSGNHGICGIHKGKVPFIHAPHRRIRLL